MIADSVSNHTLHLKDIDRDVWEAVKAVRELEAELLATGYSKEQADAFISRILKKG
jgi:hypothetical protein